MLNKIKNLPRRTAVQAAVGYGVLVLLLTYPALFHLHDRLIGNNIDNWIFYWNNWWLGQAIDAGKSWFFTPLLFFPQGTSLVAHSNSFLSSLLAWFLQPLVGPVAAFNLVWLGGLWLGAVGMFLLLRDLKTQPLAAFLGGFIFAFAPYHLTQYLAHMHLGSIHWWPFYFLFLGRSLRRAGQRDAILAGLFLALTIWTGFQLAILLGMWTAVYLLWWAWHDGRSRLKRAMRSLAVMTGVALLLGFPLLWPVLAHTAEIVSRVADFDESLIKQTDLLAYLVPPTYQPLWGEALVPVYQRFRVNQAFMPYLGGGVILLCVVAMWKRRRAAGFWAWSGLLWMLLALGSQLRFNGEVYDSVTLPYAFIRSLFPVSTIRTPDRLNLLVVVSAAVLVGLAAGWLWQQRRRRWLFFSLTLILLVDYLPAPLPMWQLPPDSSFFEELARADQPIGVVDYPMGYTISKLWLYYQTIHGQPLVEGHISRYTAATYDTIASQPILSRLYSVGENPAYLPANMFSAGAEPIANLGPALRRLHELGIGFILRHSTYTSPEELSFFQAELPLIPIYQDEVLAVFDVNQPRPWRYQTERFLAQGIELVEMEIEHDESASALQGRLLVRLSTMRGVGQACALGIEGTTAVSAPLAPFAPEAPWQTGDLSQIRLELPLPDDLTPGTFPLKLGCGENSPIVLPNRLETVAAGQYHLVRHSPGVRFGNDLVLQDLRWGFSGSRLHLALRWLPKATPGQVLKLFVHVLDDSGSLVRQLDTVPCNWQCPTDQWPAGQAVVDESSLDFWGLPAGRYRVVLGLYDSITGQRLPVFLADGTAVENESWALPELFVVSEVP